MQKPSIPKGTRDFSPAIMLKRNYLFEKIRHVYKKYGFLPIETPCIESLDVLMGKYGDEGDQLIFKILNSGDFLSKGSKEDFEGGSKHLMPLIAEKGLRYDLTVPFARYVVMNRNDISFPFKRYQIQPVWRADRPQRGRYREFYQCDADVIGTESLICEAEIMMMINDVFASLGFEDYVIKLNNRKLLTALADYLGKPGAEAELCVAIDKLDKIGKDRVFKELVDKGFKDEMINKLGPLMDAKADNRTLLKLYSDTLKGIDAASEGVGELTEVLDLLASIGEGDLKVELDLSLARGLSYYTGAIFEVKPTSVKMGTIAAGGRYDNLTEVFGMKDNSGVGVSFGIDRIYDVLDELDLFPVQNQDSTQVMLVNFDKETSMQSLQLLQKLRGQGVRSEIFPEPVKLKKQFGYADKKNIPYVMMSGSEELAKQKYTLKNMQTGEQVLMSFEEIIDLLKK